MNLFEGESTATTATRAPIPRSALDAVLTAQLVVAWAGEGGEEPRLGWWRSDLVSEFGGEDLFRRLLPDTWQWAVLQGAREAARRTDAELRGRDNNPDRILSLFNLGFELDEALEERFQDLKRAGMSPRDALPGLAEVMEGDWALENFLDWVTGHGDAEIIVAPFGRRIKGDPPTDLDRLARKLVAGLAPLDDSYRLPHFRRER